MGLVKNLFSTKVVKIGKTVNFFARVSRGFEIPKVIIFSQLDYILCIIGLCTIILYYCVLLYYTIYYYIL